MLVTVNKVNQYEENDNCKQAKNAFEELKQNPGEPTNQKDFVAFWNHIFVKIYSCSVHRSGVTANITMTEFKQRELDDDGMIWVKVKYHKTVYPYGSARLMLYPSEFEWISIFLNNVRSKISTVNTNYVFISWNGDEMTSGDISGQLHSLWEKAGIFWK